MAVEDQLTMSVVERILMVTSRQPVDIVELGASHGGIGFIRSNLNKYCDLAKRELVLLVTDLDNAACPPSLRYAWFENNHDCDPFPNNLVFSVAVREVEAWMLADRAGFCNYICVSEALVPVDVETSVADPKDRLLRVVERSPMRDIKEDVLPKHGSREKVGLGYNSRLGSFAREYWNPEIAANSNSSLNRVITRLGAHL